MIKIERTRLEFTDVNVARMAEALGVSRQTVYNWIKGRHRPTEIHVKKLLKLNRRGS